MDDGFEAVTLAGIAERAGVTATAIYNHFESREQLLYLAGRRALESIADDLGSDRRELRSATDIALAFLRPELADTRTLLIELHLASVRHPELESFMTTWHQEFAARVGATLAATGAERRASTTAFFLLLLGLCHLEQLDALGADRTRLEQRVTSMVRAIFPAADADA